ncbi:MAG TPA: hypothetical protein VKP88_08030 [Candidatus Paceibacterota bacterium]|nr:hypothetical protein [Candidatus Paceibacterota bacterium]
MTRYRATYGGQHHVLNDGQEYDIMLAEHKTFFEMKVWPSLTVVTRHNTIENLLNTWRNIRPVKINNTEI